MNIRLLVLRPGEKIHEEMITSSDSFFTYDLGKYFVIIPQTPYGMLMILYLILMQNWFLMDLLIIQGQIPNGKPLNLYVL